MRAGLTFRRGITVTAAVASLTALGGCFFIGDPFLLCGGIQGLSCPTGFFCLFEEGTCGEGDQTGLCTRLPEVCTVIFAPVCGCDGMTYENECTARGAGVSVRSGGDCTVGELPPGDMPLCGGIAGIPCGDGEFCKFEDGTCGAADQSGECMPIPDVCTEEFSPVCGCDDNTYDNECFAERAGISVLSTGACPANP